MPFRGHLRKVERFATSTFHDPSLDLNRSIRLRLRDAEDEQEREEALARGSLPSAQSARIATMRLEREAAEQELSKERGVANQQAEAELKRDGFLEKTSSVLCRFSLVLSPLGRF